MIRRILPALLLSAIAAIPAAAAQSFIYVAAAAPSCPASPCPSGQLLVFDSVTREIVATASLGSAQNVPRGMALSPDGRRLYISLLAADGSASLAVFDATRHQMRATYTLTPGVAGPVAVTRDSQRVFISGGDKLIVWDVQSTSITATHDLGVGGAYQYLFSHPTLNRVIGATVTVSFPAATLHALDDMNGSVVTSKFVGFSFRLSMSLDGTRIYNTTANWVSPTIPGHIQIIDSSTLDETGTLQSCSSCYPRHAVDAPARNRAYVLFDGVAQTRVDAYDLTTRQSLTSLVVPNDVIQATVSGDELGLWIASQKTSNGADSSADALGVVNLDTVTFNRTIPLATSPLLINPTPPGAGQCRYAINSRYSSWAREGGTATITLSTGCAWQATTSATWLHLPSTAASGFGTRTIDVAVDPYFGGDAARSATLIIGGQVVTFTQAGFGSQPAFGSLDTPADNTTGVTGSLGVTGWALDDVGVTRVRVFLEGATPAASIYVGDATLVDGARPDVATAFPSPPYATRAGWGYLLLTNVLSGGGNGRYRLHVYADDVDGHTTLLGSRTITCSNSTATVPFGAIDTPGQGETVSGTIVNWGWALTPQPGAIPLDGSTIDVVIDGVVVGRPTYGLNRPDIAALFPGYANTNNAVGYFMIDTTTLSNGVHSIAWVVRDNLGRAQGIGSRYFTVANP